jgi:hypothetical protein
LQLRGLFIIKKQDFFYLQLIQLIMSKLKYCCGTERYALTLVEKGYEHLKLKRFIEALVGINIEN